MSIHTSDIHDEHSEWSKSSIRTFIAAISLAVASGCATRQYEPPVDYRLDARWDKYETMYVYNDRSGRCEEIQKKNGVVHSIKGMSCNSSKFRRY